MKYFFFLLLITYSFSAYGQEESRLLEGRVSYISSKNIYVKFTSTSNIKVGDTLFVEKNNQLIPALVIKSKSTTSCVGSAITDEKFSVSTKIVAKPKKIKKKKKEKEKAKSQKKKKEKSPSNPPEKKKKQGDSFFSQKIKGRLSAAYYGNFLENRTKNRMRYTFSLMGKNIRNSGFSVENYMSFRHTINEWDKVKDNLNKALKIYSLAVSYETESNAKISIGRKINPKIGNMGAIDGLQLEKKFGNFSLGIIAGTRPDYRDYSLNLQLFQGGTYFHYATRVGRKYTNTTLGLIEQRNGGKVDRRFVYFQHNGELIKNLNFFTSLELDLFENINDTPKSKLRLTNFYAALRYRVSRKLRFSASFDNRQNIIYYESYKSYIDRLIEAETRQGLRFGFSFRPLKYLTWGGNTSWRFQKSDINVSKNFNTYMTYSRVPLIDARATARVNYLRTGYLTSKIVALRLSKSLFAGKLNTDVYFRNINYQYISTEHFIKQNILGVNFSIRLLKKLSLYLYSEGTFYKENTTTYRVNAKLIQRF